MKPPHEPQHPALARPGQPTSLAVAQAIEAMRDALFTAYGVDYSFQVTGRGALLGASTIHGVVEAVTTTTAALTSDELASDRSAHPQRLIAMACRGLIILLAGSCLDEHGTMPDSHRRLIGTIEAHIDTIPARYAHSPAVAAAAARARNTP